MWRPRRAGLATLAGVAVALAVAVVALSVRQQQHPAPASAPLGPPAHLGLHQLLARFAVLRRPQTAAERAWQPSPGGCGCLRRFTRLATTLPDGERVFLSVGRVRDRFEGQPLGSYMLSASLVGADGRVSLFAPSYNASWGYMRFPVVFGANPHHAWVWIGIVPDGVKSVGWVFPPQTYVIPVKGNVAAALLPASAGSLIDEVSWYGSGQRIVKRYPAQFKYVLRADGIGGARLGEPENEVVSSLRQVLGNPPRGQFVPNYLCGGADLAIYWQDLTTFFKHGRFVAYSYWTQQVDPWPSRLLATARGLTLGETPAYARRLYGRSFRTSGELGGTWFLKTSSGKLKGFTRGNSFIPGGTITTIQAGPHICETVEPGGLTQRQ
jgi:hypothetical protein